MRIIVCGGRDYNDYHYGFKSLNEVHAEWPITHIIEGGAPGGDRIGRNWAILRGIPYTTVKADWKRFGKSAGYRRNEVMARDHAPDGVLALPGGKGTQHMIDIARRYKLPLRVIT